MKLVFEDQAFSYELLRAISHTYARAADIGECLSTARRIREGDFDSWYTHWRATAERVHDFARESLERGHGVSAREALLRASNYYRTAEFFLHVDPSDPRVLETWRLSADCFRQAAELFTSPSIEPIEIPYEGTTLPGYLYRVDGAAEPRRTLIFHGGFDSTVEELHPFGAQMAVDRGWNVIAFDGPGQGRVIREQGLTFRHDWEAVVAPVLEHARSLPEVDPDRIALMGMSLGGYLAVRAAAFVDVAATVAFNGLWSLGDALAGMVPAETLGLLDRDEEAFDAELGRLMEVVPTLRWAMSHGMYTMGFDRPAPMVRAMRDYTVEPIVEQVSCPTLVLDAEDDHFFDQQAQARRVYEALRGPKGLVTFTADEGAEEHCQVGAMGLHSQRVFDWLEELPVFAVQAGEPAAAAA